MNVIVRQDFDQAMLRRAFGCFPSGVAAFCGLVDGRPDGMAASSFTSVSLGPPLVLVCVQNTSATWSRIAGLPRLGISVLAAEHGPVAQALASKDGDRFSPVQWEATESGAVFVHGSSLWLECSVHDVVGAGDHRIVLLQVESLAMSPDTAPLVFHASGFHEIAASA
jgi:flavin reductase (DIM6/NTAB) family NADH-FMN oxidoreductase RutF